MPTFFRAFDVPALAVWDKGADGNAVRALFDRWALPGVAGTGAAMLRVGVRAGYMNFYAKGQSIAKLSIVRDKPRLSVHRAYVEGRKRREEPREQGYVPFDAGALADPATAALIDGWIATALTYASAEKRFVDDLAGANAGVIDLEMALPAHDLPAHDLPAHDLPDSAKVAPRMDLVMVEPGADGPAISFWEAKCANNGELRASADREPSILHQIDTYVAWMGADGRVGEVRAAYRCAATVLLQCVRHFRPADAAAACISLWQALVDAQAPAVIVRPGVVIGNDWPHAYIPCVARERMRQAAASFARNGHDVRLMERGIRLHQVGEGYGMPVLPLLSGGASPA